MEIGRLVRVYAGITTALAALAAPAALAESPAAPRSLPLVARPALAIASRWLEAEACRDVFADFHDASGRTLREKLDSLGVSPAAFLGTIAFVDGAEEGRCAEHGILATTTPGGSEVRLCRAGIASLARRDPPALAVVLVHEELHSLGLGENPPSSREISRRIEARCR